MLPEYLSYFCKKICYQDVQKSPNLVTLIACLLAYFESLFDAKRRFLAAEEADEASLVCQYE